MRLIAGAVGLALAVAAQGCKSSTGPNSQTGRLIVTFGPVGRTSPFAVISGPNGDTTTVSTTDTLVGLAPGRYTILRAGATTSNTIVSILYRAVITGSPATVAAGQTATISIRFEEARDGSGGLWVTTADSGRTSAVQYTSAQLTAGGPAGIALQVSGANSTFDAAGDLWVGDSAANTLVEYASAQLAASGTPSPTVSITSPALAGPVGLVFDQLGDLWVSNFNANTIIELTPNQLRRGGVLTPTVVVSGLALDGPARMAFDTSGDLWVANTLSSTVVAMAAASLAKSGSPLPAITLTAADTSLNGPSGLAFDQAGNLWVANSVGGSIVAFNPSQLAASGSTTPLETLVLPDTAANPTTVAFDNNGDLWTNSTTGAAILEYTGVQLAVGDTVPPALMINVPGVPASLAFNPPPDSLPLSGSLGSAAIRRNTPLGGRLRRR